MTMTSAFAIMELVVLLIVANAFAEIFMKYTVVIEESEEEGFAVSRKSPGRQGVTRRGLRSRKPSQISRMPSGNI